MSVFNKAEYEFIRQMADAILRGSGTAHAAIITTIDGKCVGALEKMGEDPLGKKKPQGAHAEKKLRKKRA